MATLLHHNSWRNRRVLSLPGDFSWVFSERVTFLSFICKYRFPLRSLPWFRFAAKICHVISFCIVNSNLFGNSRNNSIVPIGLFTAHGLKCFYETHVTQYLRGNLIGGSLLFYHTTTDQFHVIVCKHAWNRHIDRNGHSKLTGVPVWSCWSRTLENPSGASGTF